MHSVFIIGYVRVCTEYYVIILSWNLCIMARESEVKWHRKVKADESKNNENTSNRCCNSPHYDVKCKYIEFK